MDAKSRTLTQAIQEMRQLQLNHLRKDIKGMETIGMNNHLWRQQTGTRDEYKL